MFRLRLMVLTGAALFAAALLHAENPVKWVEFNGTRVHATRLLVRLQAGSEGDLTVSRPVAVGLANSLGLRVRRDYNLVPGLMVLDEPAGAAGTASVASPDTRLARLADRMKTLRDSGLFQYVEPDYMRSIVGTPTDAAFEDGTLWGLRNEGQQGGVAGVDVEAVKAWGINTGSKSVVVAVIDTGIRYTHKDLAENMWTNPKEIPGNGIDDDGNGYIDDVHGINAITGSGDPFDDNDHGTHVSGTIGAAANNGYPHVGVNWQVSLMGLKFLDANGGGFDSDAIECIQYAVNMKVRVSNNSWGGGGADQALGDALLAARAAGHLFVAAAGNSSSNNDSTFFSPASYPFDNIISVAAIDRKGQLASFSSYGSKTVHIGAPGVDIFSSITTSDSSYDHFDGTSMATPHVVGVAALVLAEHPKADLFELRQRILNSAVPTPALQGKTITGGRVSAYNALIGISDGKLKLSISPPDGAQILLGTNTPIFVQVFDFLPITNALVTNSLTVAGVVKPPLVFANDGKAPDVAAIDGIYSTTLKATVGGAYQLTIIASADKKVSVTNTVTYTVAQPPSNDGFASPRKLAATGELVTDGNTSLATLQVGEPMHAGVTNLVGSLWYAWTPAATGSVLLDTYGSTVPLALAVYGGTTLTTLSNVASVRPNGAQKGVATTFSAKAGVTYRIAVAGVGEPGRGPIRLQLLPQGVPDVIAPQVAFNNLPDGLIATTNLLTISGTALDGVPSPSGVSEVQVSVNGQSVTVTGLENWTASAALKTGVNTISVVAKDFAENRSASVSVTVNYRQLPAANDLFVQAVLLPGIKGQVTGDNSTASREFQEPQHGGSGGGHSAWWAFTAPFDGVLDLSTTNSTFDTLLGAYLGDRVGDLTELGQNDDAVSGSSYSALRVPVKSGQVVHIAVDGFSGATGMISLAYGFNAAKLFALSARAGSHGSISGGNGLYVANSVVSLTATPDEFYVFSGWSGSFSSNENPLSVTVNRDLSLVANFQPQPVDDDFESGTLSKLSWQGLGNALWTVQSNVVDRGIYSAKAGTIANSQSSSLVLVTNSVGGAGSFDLQVSSEAGFDSLEFYLNDNLLESWSGDVPWMVYNFAIPAGLNRFEWRYVKDGDRIDGADTAYIDNVRLLLRPGATVASTPSLNFVGFANGVARVQVSGQLNQIYILQSSLDFSKWTSLSTNVNTSGSYLVVDAAVSTKNFRFYRAVVAP